MAASTLALVADDERGRDGAWVAEALAAGFTVRPQPGQRGRSLWLDSFDWRLLGAGLVLRQDGRAPRAELVVERISGDELDRQPAAVSWPSLMDGLMGGLMGGLKDGRPDGALGTEVGAALGVRALLPLVEVTVRTAHLWLLDDEDKTVVRVAIDDAVTAGQSPTTLPLRIGLTAVRGYERELDRAVRLLRSVDGVRPAARSLRQDALLAAGLDEGGYTGRVTVALDAAAPAGQSVATVLRRLVDTVALNVAGTVADWDTEFLHDLRIGVRQTRSVLKFSGDVLPDGLAAAFADHWRWVAALTTPTRDLDVMLLGLDGLADGFDIDGLTDLEPLQQQLRSRRRIEFRRLRTGLASARFTTLLRDWPAALTAAERDAGPPGPSTGELAAARIARAHRRLLKRAAAITAESKVDDLHELRKSGKELRYVLDVFRSLHDPAIHKRLIRELKALQDCLGDIQDSHVHHDQLAAFVASDSTKAVPTATLLAVGALIDRLQTRQQRAQTELMSRLTAFTASATTAQLAELARSAE